MNRNRGPACSGMVARHGPESAVCPLLFSPTPIICGPTLLFAVCLCDKLYCIRIHCNRMNFGISVVTSPSKTDPNETIVINIEYLKFLTEH